MIKTLSVFLLAFMVCLFAKAQQPASDTTVYYMKTSGFTVPDKNSADYMRYILPAKTINGVNYYPVVDNYLNGSTKLAGFSTTNTSDLLLAGKCVRYYPNGNVKSEINYQRGIPVNHITAYYPNGQIYIIGKFGTEERTYNNKISYLSECRDSTGKILATNGEGKWIKYDDDFKTIVAEGTVSKGLEQGPWTFTINDKYLNAFYKNGILTTAPDYESTGEINAQPDVMPAFKEDLGTFDRFIWNNVKYPFDDPKATTGGRVVVSFVVEIDGNLSNFKVISAPGKAFGNAAINVLKLSPPWRAAYAGGKPVRAAYTYPIKFTYGQK